MPYDATPAEIRTRLREYQAYLQRLAHRFPARALDFASAEWHYTHDDHRCPHDAWVESVSIVEVATGERHEVRALELRLELLGAFHDGLIRLTYPNVRRYSLLQPCLNERPSPPVGHGDWLVDEVRLSEESRPEAPVVLHEIVFSRGGHWTIEAGDIIFEWLPGGHRPSMAG